MKPIHFLISLVLFQISLNCFSQVAFCPPGAKWTAIYSTVLFSQSLKNTSIVYERDTIVGTDTLKLLRHTKFYSECNFSDLAGHITLIKQKGDTVFMRNQFTQQNWQVLFNYGCLPGQSWTTTYTLQNAFQTSPSCTYTILVDSVTNIVENSVSLRKLWVTVSYPDFTSVVVRQTTVVERYGWGFLFNYKHDFGCDGDRFMGSLCYSDNVFGTKYFGSASCNYEYLTSIDQVESQKNKGVSVYPNPFSDDLTFQRGATEGLVEICDEFGQLIKRVKVQDEIKIDVSNLPCGIYFMRSINGGETQTQKLFKISN